ncbi:synaptotagmin-like protein 2 [Lithobates pipiens]
MIDLSFLTEAEQEAILKVLNRDAELKKSEDERVKNLQDVVHDENEFKYKSGQWFYDAKSKRHREKINGVDLVRASIRKRKKPATIAELSELNKDSSKRRWVNSVNQDLFIPPELYGVMEAPDETEEDIMVKKQEGNQSSKKVGLTSTEKQDNLRNGTFSPPKARQNPFNSEGLQDETDYNNEAPSLNPENVKMNGTEKPKSDIMSSLAKYGVKLPYPEQSKSSLNAPKAQDGNKSQKEDVSTPVPKPRTFKVNGQPQDRSNSMLKRDDSLNGTGKPRGILKRRSSSSSTDSESIRIAQSVEPSKIVLAGSPILEAGQNNFFDEQDSTSDNTADKLKQVRFSEKIQQRLPSPIPEPYSLREVGEYGILDPGLSVNGLDNGLEDHSDSEDSTLDRDSSATEMLMKILEQNAMLEKQASVIEQPPSLEIERNQVAPKEDLSKNDTLRLEASTDISIDPPSNNFSDKEPLYAVVNKTSAASSPSQAQDFDMDDALMEPRFHGQRGKTQNIYLNEKPLEFGKSFSGGGKVTFESSYPSKKHKESYSLSSEEDLTPERDRTSKSSPSNVVNKPVAIAQDGDDPVESVALWRQPFKLENQEPRRPSPELTKEQKTDIKAKDSFGKTYSENLPTSKTASGENGKETEYKSIVLQNRYDAERKPLGLTANLVQNMSQPSKTSGELDSLLHKNEGRKDLARSLHFNVMSLKDRMNEMPREQMSNPSQFQSLKHFWNVEEKNLPGETTVTSPDKILMHVSSRNKPTRSDIRRRSSEIPADKVLLPNAPDNLSEEEQTSQKVASWLAQTPTVYVDGQMDQNEDQLSSGKDNVEHAQKSAIPKRSDFTNALKRREESLEAPKITEKSKTNEIQIMSQGEPDLGYHKQTTITFSPISQNYIERSAPTTDLKMTDRGFYGRVVQMSNKLSPAKETLSVEPKHEPYDEIMDKTLAPEKSPRESRIGFETLNGISDEELSLPKEESETEEIIEKSAAPRSREQQDFIFALKKLEIEASKQPPLPDFEVKDQGEIPKEEITQNAVTPVKSSFKMGFEQFSPPNATNELETYTDQAEEIIEKSAVPKSRDQQDFIFALKKLEIEASKQPPLPDFEVKDQGEIPKEEMTQNTVTPVKSSFKMGFEQFSPPSATNELETSTDQAEEIIEKSAVPKSRDQQDFIFALKKLEIEASKPPLPDFEVAYQDGLPKEEIKQNTVTPVKSSFKIDFDRSSSANDNVFEKPTDRSVKFQPQRSYASIKESGTEVPSYMEETIEKSTVPSKKDNEDLSIALRKLELEAIEHQSDEEYVAGINQGIPEDPDDLLVDDTVKVSQFPNREVVISKKVYSSIESMPSIENFSESGKAKEVDSSWNTPKGVLDPKSHDYSYYEELAYYPHSPEPSGSYTGNGNLPYKKPEVGSPEVSNSKPGKPALSESPSDTSSSKNDKYEFMVMKAQDESISKVLDWFSKSSEIEGNPPSPVGMLQPSKGTSSQILIQTGGNKKESGPNENNFKTLSEPTSYLESPNTAGEQKSSLSILGTQNGDNSDIPNVKLPATVSLVEDNGVPSGIIQFSSENRSPLQYGNRGGGSGKISNQEANTMQDNGQCQEAKYLDISEVGKEGLGTEVPIVALKQDRIPVASEFMSNHQISEMVEKPHSRSSLSSTDTNNDQSDIENDELLTQANSIENASPPRVNNSNLEAGNCLEFGKNGSGSGKMFSPSQVSEIKEPRLSVSSTDTKDDQFAIKNSEPLTQANSIENTFPPRVMHSNLEAGNCLEFDKNGSGSGKTSSPSQEISKFKKPRLSLSSTDTDDDQSGIKNDELLTQTSKENISPSRLINLNLEYGTSGGGSGKTSSPSQEISTFKKPRLSLSSTDTDDDQSGIKNDELLTQTSKENISPSRLINLNLEYGTSGGESGKTSSPSQEISTFKKPRLSLSSTDTDDDQSGIKIDELLTQTSKENISPSRLINLNLEYGTSGGESGKTSSPSQEISTFKKPRLSLSSTDTDDDQSGIKNDELLTQTSKENISPSRLINLNLEYGTSGGESGKTSSPSQEISTFKKPRLSLSSTDTDDDQSGIKNDELLTQTSKENISPSRLINLNLEYGTSGGESGKTSSPSQEISTFKKPRLSLSSTDTDDDQSGIKNDELLTQTSKENISPPSLINLNLEAENCLQYDTSGGGSDKPVSPNQEIPEVRKPSLLLSSTDSTDHDLSETGNVALLTLVQVMKEESVPPAKINPVENLLDLGKSKGGASKLSNQAADYMLTDPQLKEDKEVFDKGEEGLKGEKESDLLTDDPQIQRMVEAETLNMDSENRPLDGSRPESVDYIKIEVPPSHNTVKFNVPQRRVSDIKQFWEGDKSALPAAKKTILSSSKQMLGSREISITPQSSSIESDDQNSPSLVTFKRVMVEEEEENALLPVDQLKSFWENEKNEVVLNAKQPDGSLVKNSSLDADEVSALAESRSKFKKRHTFHSFFENEQNSTGKNPPGRSVSLSESSNDNLKDRHKSTTFQNLRSFWNVDHKANPNDRTLSDTKNRQFRSNPDLSKESFVAKIKSKLESQSLEDIREDTPDTQVQPVKDVYNHKNKTPLLSTFIKQKSSDNSLRNSVEEQENVSVFQACNPIEITSVSETQTKSKSSFEVSDHKEVSEVVVKSAQKPEKLNEFSLRLQKLRDEFSDKSLEGATSVKLEYKPKNDEMANGDVENQNLTVNKNGERMLHKECERRQPLVKQIGLDDENSSVGAEAFHFLKNYERDNLKNDKAQVDNGEHVYETVERTLIPPPKHSADFDRGLQKLYNELLEASPVSEVKLSQNEFMNMQSPEENFSKVLTVSSNKIKSNVQRSSSFQQPIVINLSSTKINVSNETTGKHGVNLDEESETSIARECDLTPALTPAEKEERKKEIVERIDMPKVVPRAPFNYFDEGLKKLYDESRDLTATKPVSGSLQALPAKQDLVMRESVTSVSQAPVILEQEIGETIGKASAPTKIYHAKSSEKDQKEDVNDEEEPFMGNVPSNHVTSEESQPRFSEHIVAEGTVSEMSPKGKEASVEENVQSLQYETIQESPSKTDSPFIEMRQSSPMKEKSSSLRKSTLELYLEVPYRREMSKSMDFELGGYIASDVDKDGCMDESNPILRALKRSEAKMLNSKAVEEVSPTSTNQLNSSSPTEDIPVNSFPQNAETLKRLSQSVPAFINDDTDGRDTDSASESSFQIGRHKKSPSSLTNLSGSSGMASMSSVSGSVMSIYSGDFGNVDIKGGIEFSIDYVEQLKEFLIYVYQCRELAVAEVKKQRSDPYVKAYLLPEKAKMGKRKTAVKKKTLNPVYNEILRYKIPKDSLLAQTLNLSVWHHDALGRNSFLGEVNVNLETWDWSNTQRKWYQLEPRTPAAGIGLENRGEMKLALKYVPMSTSGDIASFFIHNQISDPQHRRGSGTKPNLTGEVHISIKDCLQLPMLRGNKINSFVKCTVLPDTSRKSRQRTRTVDKTPNPYFNHTMVYDGFKEEDLREACVELTVWDHNRLSNHFLGGLRIGLGTGKSYGTAVDWMDSTHEEATMWEKMMASPNTWVEGMLPLRMFKMAKLAK